MQMIFSFLKKNLTTNERLPTKKRTDEREEKKNNRNNKCPIPEGKKITRFCVVDLLLLDDLHWMNFLCLSFWKITIFFSVFGSISIRSNPTE